MLFNKNKKSFHFQITRIIISLCLLLAIIISFTSYLIAKNVLLKNQINSTEKLMNKMVYSICQSDIAIRHLCEYVYLSSDVAVMLNSDTENENSYYILTKVFSNLSASVPSFHSVQLYNSNTGNLYYLGPSAENEDKQFQDIKKIGEKIKSLRMIPRTINEMVNREKKEKKIFSYFVGDGADISKDDKSFMMLNIKEEWLEESLKQLTDDNEYAYILNPDKKIICSANKKLSVSGEKLLKNKDFFKEKIDGETYVVVSKYIENLDLYIVKLMSERVIYSPLRKLRLAILLSLFLFLLLAVYASSVASKYIYHPIGTLYRKVSGKSEEENINVITEMEKLYEKSSKSAEKAIRHKQNSYYYLLNRLIKPGASINKSEMQELLSGKDSPLAGELYAICMFELDDFEKSIYEAKDEELIKYAIINISTELIEEKYKCTGLFSEGQKIAVIINIPYDEDDYMAKISECAEKIERNMYNYFEIHVSSYISRTTDDIYELQEICEETTRGLLYKYNYDYGCCLNDEKIPHEEKTGEVSKELLKDVSEGIAAFSETGLEAAISSVEEEIKGISFISRHEAIMNFIKFLNENLEKHGLKEKIDEFEMYRVIYEKKYISIIFSKIKERISEIIRTSKTAETKLERDKTKEYAKKIKNIIDDEYSSQALCVAAISDEIDLSPRKVSKYFKDIYKIPVHEYILNVRMENAKKLLSEEDLTVYDIAAKTGFGTESYFYRLFKQKYGMTPKEFAERKPKDRKDNAE